MATTSLYACIFKDHFTQRTALRNALSYFTFCCAAFTLINAIQFLPLHSTCYKILFAWINCLTSSRFSSTPTILNYLSYTVHQCEDALSNKKNSSGLRLMIYFLSFLFLHIKSSVFVSFKWFFTSVQFRDSEKCNIKTLEEGHSKHSDWKSKAQTIFVNLIF